MIQCNGLIVKNMPDVEISKDRPKDSMSNTAKKHIPYGKR